MNRVVVVSNRVPAPAAAGAQAGGLAVALEGVMQRRGGVWFGWSGKVAPGAADQPTHIVQADQVVYATVDLSPEEHDRYYNNFANGVLWPLLHTMPDLVAFDRQDAVAYRAVNARMADALLPLLRPNDLIWVHDYHLLAIPTMLRERGVLSPIGFFLHIPFPSLDVLNNVPETAELIRDLLAADLIGFQTDRDLENFVAAAESLAGAVAHSDGWLQLPSHRVRLGVFPVEIDPSEFAATATAAWRAPPAERLRRSLLGQKLIIGVDRLDPTKGLPQRLDGFRRLLETRPEWRRRATFLQIAAASRKDVTAYKDLRTALDLRAGAINADFSDPDWVPLRMNARGVARNIIAGYMREARVGLVTPRRDGMNLVAKEFVAAQDPRDPGVLILSRFAGAARQLEAALLVNPNDIDDLADALDQALRMDLAERQQRWQQLWRAIADTSPLGWGRSFLAALLRTALVADPSAAAERRPARVGRTGPGERSLPRGGAGTMELDQSEGPRDPRQVN
jgi:trehalose 6-phosphate synthase